MIHRDLTNVTIPRQSLPGATAYMLIKTRRRILCCSMLLIFSVQSKADAYVVGTAYAPGSEQILYTESYTKNSATRAQVKYESAEGGLLADKQLDFSHDKHAPDIVRNDYRLNLMLTITTKNNKTLLQAQRKGEDALDATLEVEDKLVIDAGFDFFVQDQWHDLMQGEDVKFRYLVPARNKAIKLKLRQRDCAPAAPQKVCFRVKPTNWIIAAVMPPIDLEYDSNSLRLMRFSGFGQLPDSKGKSQEVDIHYRYPEADYSL